jgi:hypothetical protein
VGAKVGVKVQIAMLTASPAGAEEGVGQWGAWWVPKCRGNSWQLARGGGQRTGWSSGAQGWISRCGGGGREKRVSL